MSCCPDLSCSQLLSDHDQALGLCPACGRPLPVDSQALLERHRKNLNLAARHGKIVETWESVERFKR